MNPFDFVNAINSTKANIMSGTENDALAEAAYTPYVVNKALSYFPDTIMHANEINRLNTLPNALQFSYYLNSIRPAKRFAKWVKRENVEDVECVKQYYGYSTDKALQALTILTRDQLHHIKQKLSGGGINNEVGNAR